METSARFAGLNGGIAADGPFWEGLGDGLFRLPQCPKCRQWMWPAHYRCPCGSWDFDWIALEPDALVYSWTRTWYAFDRVAERAEDLPYVTILAEIPQGGGARVMGMLEGDDAGLAIGAPLRGVIHAPDPKSKGYPSICWRLVRS